MSGNVSVNVSGMHGGECVGGRGKERGEMHATVGERDGKHVGKRVGERVVPRGAWVGGDISNGCVT